MRACHTIAACYSAPARSSSRRILAPMTDGPFHPSRSRCDGGPLAGDWDADLTARIRATPGKAARKCEAGR